MLLCPSMEDLPERDSSSEWYNPLQPPAQVKLFRAGSVQKGKYLPDRLPPPFLQEDNAFYDSKVKCMLVYLNVSGVKELTAAGE